MRTCALAIAVVALAGLVFAAPSVATLHIEKQVPLGAGWSVAVLHRYGSVVIIGSGDAGARADALVRVTASSRELAEEFARGVNLSVGTHGDTVVIATLYPAHERADSELGYEVDLNVRMPTNARVAVGSSFGDVRVAGIRGDFRVTNHFGDVEVDRCVRGEVNNSYGSVRLVGTRGMVKVKNSYGDVDLVEASGPVQVANRYGTVHSEQSAGDVSIDNQFGNVFARPDRGALSITNRYGDIDAWVASTELTALNIMSRLGRVDLSLTSGVPFQLDASAIQGRIMSGLPFVVHEVGTRQQMSARHGSGGPRIGLDGVWSSFAIHRDTAESLPAAGPDQREERR